MQLQVFIEWKPIKRSLKSDDLYYYPRSRKKGEPYIKDSRIRKRLHNHPAVYRWIVFTEEIDIPWKSWIYVGETENIYRRIGHYLNPDKSQDTNLRLKNDFMICISKGFRVRLDILNVNVLSDEYKINDLFKEAYVRKLFENLVIRYYEKQGIHLLNDPYWKKDPEYLKFFSVQ